MLGLRMKKTSCNKRFFNKNPRSNHFLFCFEIYCKLSDSHAGHTSVKMCTGLLNLLKFMLILTCATVVSPIQNYRFCEYKTSDSIFLKNELLVKFNYLDIPNWAQKSFHYVNCSRRGLEAVPTLSSDTEFLDMSRNHLRKITAQSFLALDNLIILYLDGNCIKKDLNSYHPVCETDLSIESGSFQNLKKLKILSLKYNYLREFPQSLPSTISLLDISSTMLGNITSDLQKSGLNLTALSAHGNCFKEASAANLCPRNFEISSKISPTLQFVDLRLNSLEKIPKYLLSPSLDVFVIALNPVTRLSKSDFDEATNIRVLLIQGMKRINATKGIEIEEGVFDPLVNLQILDLSANFIRYIPKNLFRSNTKLQYLDLSLNKLSKTMLDPVYLGHLRMLRYLDVSSNALENKMQFDALNLGASYCNLTSLETLMIGFPPNTLLQITEDRIELSDVFHYVSSASILILSRLRNLTRLSLSGLSLKAVNASQWLQLKHLNSFHLDYNSIQFHKLSLDAVNGFKTEHVKLKKLRYNPRRTQISPMPFNDVHTESTIVDSSQRSFCSSDEVLDFSRNDISFVEQHISYFLSSACKVDLSYNSIHFIYNNTFVGFSNLIDLILDHNPLYHIDSNALFALDSLKRFSIHYVALNDRVDVLNFLTRISDERNITLKWKQKWAGVFNILLLWEPEVQGHFGAIDYLDLSGNFVPPKFLGKLFTVLRSFQNLQSLTIRNCGIVNELLTVSLESVENSLKYLDLGANKLNQLPANHSRNLKKLEVMKLDHNVISSLEGDFLSSLSLLRKFVVSHNEISYIQSGFFSCVRLKYVDMSNNFIARLGDDIFPTSVLSNLEYLDIRGNDLDCSCGVWEVFYLWTVSSKAEDVLIPGYLPVCSSELDEFYGGCVACGSPYRLHSSSLLSYCSFSFCGFTQMLTYCFCFSSFISLFLLFSMLFGSKRFKRTLFRKVNEQFRINFVSRRTQAHPVTKSSNNVFVIFDLSDNEIGDWVDYRLSKAMKNGRPSLPLIIVGKDDSCGVAPSQQMLQRIMTCRNSLLILTKDFCYKPECR